MQLCQYPGAHPGAHKGVRCQYPGAHKGVHKGAHKGVVCATRGMLRKGVASWSLKPGRLPAQRTVAVKGTDSAEGRNARAAA